MQAGTDEDNTGVSIWLNGWRGAWYKSGSGTDTLVFGYTVKPSDRDDNGLTISNGGIDNDGKLYGLPRDALIIAVDNAKERNPWYSGQTNVSGHKVDRRPYVENVSIISTPAADDTYTAGETTGLRPGSGRGGHSQDAPGFV